MLSHLRWYYARIDDKGIPQRGMGFDFVDFQHDSANFKQVWSALAALEVLFVFVLAEVEVNYGNTSDK